MIYKVVDRNRVIHYNVVGFNCPVKLCETKYCARSVSPVSWRRTVDCMVCLVRFASLTWCGHGSGETIRVDSHFDGHGLIVLGHGWVKRQCHLCSTA